MVLTETTKALYQPLMNLWNGFLTVIPGIIAAIIVLLIGYLIAALIGWVVNSILDKIKFNKWLVSKTHLDKAVGKLNISLVLSLIIKWYVFILFLPTAATLIKLNALSDFLVNIGNWIPNLIAAVLVGIVGIITADYVVAKILSTKAKGALLIADTAKIIILIFTLVIALEQIGFAIEIVRNSFLIVVAGIVFAVALAIGLSFGLGNKGVAKKIVSNFKKKL